ncbi:hypothetical protein RRG08_060916 [Elysia crispata]|uniref:Uncharacterized protein n=1 Tax=Elysia crispata TaxID=231223 RepID=A0AAE0Z1V5_9GAST|nr:hypothetical protein RRG08_060916 [Elysia crispata]
MSRAAPAKTRGADKTKPPASQTPVIAHEIIPGKFNDNDWNFMVDRDGADEFVTDIVDELMETTMSAIYDKYIQSQLLPFTITQARDAITEIIEWQFLARDEGEQHIETDLGWAQDEEPEPAVTDCWAQGSVPRNFVPIPEAPLEEIPEEPAGEEEIITEVAVEKEVTVEPPEVEDTVSETDTMQKVEAIFDVSKDEEDLKRVQAQENKQKTRPKFRPYKGKLKSAGVRKMVESLEETEMKMMYDEMAASRPGSDEMPSTLLNMPASCTSILKVQTGRPPGNKDVVYDDFGNVVAVMKLDPEKLPTHKVNVKYHVVDPAVEAAQARLDAMRKGKSTGSKQKKMRSMKNNIAESVTTVKRDHFNKSILMLGKSSQIDTKSKRGSSVSKPKSNALSSTMAPLPPPLIEEMEVSHGVIIREGGRVKKGPGRYYRKLDILEESQKGMTPVTLRISNPGITVADLLDRHTPILRPLSESSPLPPIVPQPPAQHPQQAV